MSPFIIAGNWKMNKTPKEALEFIKDFKQQFRPQKNKQILFFPTYLSLPTFRQEFLETPISYGAQNCYHQPSGAYTGEISVSMLRAYGCGYSLVGHSERRTLFFETDDDVAKKVKALQEGELIPVICIGETEQQRSAGLTLKVVESQLLAALSLADFTKPLLFAYEPVWAIGTGKVATLSEIAEVHQYLRQQLDQKMGNSGKTVPLLYGGSVNSQNARDIASVKEVNGFLIGGASLKVSSLLEIYNQ